MCLGTSSPQASFPLPPWTRRDYPNTGMSANADNKVIESGGSPNESVSNERDMDKAPGSIGAKAEEVASYYTTDERAMASGEYTSIELKAWEDSFKAAGEVLNASPSSNPIPGVTHFYDITRKTNPWPSATQVPYGSGTLLYFKDVP